MCVLYSLSQITTHFPKKIYTLNTCGFKEGMEKKNSEWGTPS